MYDPRSGPKGIEMEVCVVRKGSRWGGGNEMGACEGGKTHSG
jgi:hypothetical protein